MAPVMTALLLQLVVAQTPGLAPPAARAILIETSTAQLDRFDPRWPESQRDCAGLVRFSYRQAAARLVPGLLQQGLWRDSQGQAVAFADAQTLLRSDNFKLLGRSLQQGRSLQTGDLIAFAQRRGLDQEPTFHLMMVLRPPGATSSDLAIIYHTGDSHTGMRAGRLRDYESSVPAEWQIRAANPAFLGFFRHARWRDWSPVHPQIVSTRSEERQP